MKILLLIAVMMTTALNGQGQTYLDAKAPIEERIKDALSRMTVHEKIMLLHAQSKFTSAGVPRLGIRQLNMDDGPHGVREELEWNSWKAAKWTNDSVVAFPSLTCLAATWNTEMAARYGDAVSEEFAFRGKDVMLGPGVNIQRTPMNGRAFEYMGEDPMLAACMVVPYIQAVQHNGVGCCLKHFALNEQETDRFTVNVNVSERALREIYLYPFERAAKEAHVWTIMGSYNLWEGVHCCQHNHLLNDILKKEWQWDGAVISDWGGTTDSWQAATGGLDIEMGTFTDGKLKESEFTYDDYYLAKPFEQMIKEGRLPMSLLDEKAGRVLRTIFRTAMNPEKVIGSLCSEAHYEACREIGEEGIVLLKNEAVRKGKDALLPLDVSRYQRILVVGENATRSLTQGGGSSELKTKRDLSPLESLQAVGGATIDYAQGYYSGRALYDKVDKVSDEETARLFDEALQKASTADLIIFIGGLNKNHRQDCENGDRESYSLPFGQDELISKLAAIQPNIVVVTFGGNPYAMPWLEKVPALLHGWYLGSEAGHSLCRILTGEVSPSGKLPVTFARQYEDYPYVQYGDEAWPGVNRQVYYKEDLFVGYRGFEHQGVKPLFPFGFGLSYTHFDYDNMSAVVQGDSLTVSVTVSNTGKRAGKEVVQVYASSKNSGKDRPQKELKAFAKTQLLNAGNQQKMTITFPISRLAIWDEQTHQWQVRPDTYTLHIGSSSADIRGKVKVKL